VARPWNRLEQEFCSRGDQRGGQSGILVHKRYKTAAGRDRPSKYAINWDKVQELATPPRASAGVQFPDTQTRRQIKRLSYDTPVGEHRMDDRILGTS